jgi:glucose-1-phosphate thymidylyltransferase
MKAVILAGGKGDGLYPLTEGQQKELLSVLGKPVLSYVMEGLMKAGISEFVIVTSDKGREIERELTNTDAGYEVVYQKKEGIEGAISEGISKISDKYYVLAFGDIITSSQLYSSLLSLYYTNGKPSISLTPIGEGFNTYGLVEIEGGRIKVVRSGSTLALAGAYVLPTETMDNFEEYLSSLNPSYFVWSGPWVDIGYPEDILTAIENLLNERRGTFISDGANVARSAVLGNQVIIEDRATIEDYAVIKGPAYIGKDAYIGNFSLIRSFSSIERSAIIGAYSEVAHTLVGQGVEIGSKSYLTYSVVGREAKIGAGTITKTSMTNKVVRGRSNKFGCVIPPKGKVDHGSVLKPFYAEG